MAWPTTTIVTTDMDAGTDSAASARAQIKQMADNVNDIKDARRAVNGISSLDSSGTVPTAELPVIPAAKGGTGQSSFTIGDLLCASSTTALSKVAAGSTGYVLKSNGVGAQPSWQLEGGGLTSGTRLGFQQTSAPTGWTKDTSGAINDSIMRLTTGTAGSGGSLAFSTWAAVTTTGAHQLTAAQMPSHTHGPGAGNRIVNTAATSLLGAAASIGSAVVTSMTLSSATASAGSDGTHSHTLSQNMKYYDFIIATKD